jgi:hypothetical protein
MESLLILLQTIHKKSEMLFVRGKFFRPVLTSYRSCIANRFAGDSVVLISPQAPS